jgi:hypothetical protein
VVSRLDELAPADLRKIETYEKGHKNRRGVLERIRRLRTEH